MEEIEYRTPNGLHDAYLLGISTNYEDRTLRLKLNWLVGLPSDATPREQNAYRTGELVISDLRYCVVEAPVKGTGDRPDQIHGFVTDADTIKSCNLPDVGEDAFRYSIFVGYWTSFIHFAGSFADVVPTDLIVREMGA
jgi:hypothetical protein